MDILNGKAQLEDEQDMDLTFVDDEAVVSGDEAASPILSRQRTLQVASSGDDYDYDDPFMCVRTVLHHLLISSFHSNDDDEESHHSDASMEDLRVHSASNPIVPLGSPFKSTTIPRARSTDGSDEDHGEPLRLVFASRASCALLTIWQSSTQRISASSTTPVLHR